MSQLSKITVYLLTLFFVFTLTLAIMTGHRSKNAASDSVMKNAAKTEAAAEKTVAEKSAAKPVKSLKKTVAPQKTTAPKSK